MEELLKIKEIIDKTGICHISLKDMVTILTKQYKTKITNENEFIHVMFKFTRSNGMQFISIMNTNNQIGTVRLWYTYKHITA